MFSKKYAIVKLITIADTQLLNLYTYNKINVWKTITKII
jgi:hypothetical protein